jgi:hypothetical protein
VEKEKDDAKKFASGKAATEVENEGVVDISLHVPLLDNVSFEG